MNCHACKGTGHGVADMMQLGGGPIDDDGIMRWHCERCGGRGRLDTMSYTEHGDRLPDFSFASAEDDASLRKKPKHVLWSDVLPPPSIGAKVRAPGELGEGEVVGYFSEHGYLGVLIRFDKPPAWYVKQNGATTPGHIYGAELRRAREAQERKMLR